ncbi:teichoic acid biosynthesis protein C [Streptomyces sp. NPDC058426]|uniref:phage baseplate protein n=1 Tax=Streptomyces sp. NPDC058426 TaxID=3346493 RepID=UPI00364D3E8D
MIQNSERHPSRRALLALGGAGALSAAAVPLAAGTAAAATSRTTDAAPSRTAAPAASPAAAAAAPPAPGSALLVDSPRLDLNSPAENWIREKATKDLTIIQSFGYDNANGHLYLLQVTPGGLRLDGESAPVSAVDRSVHGDLTLTKWDLSGAMLGHMYLRGFGHGMNIGVEPVGGSAYLWTEVDAVPLHAAPPNENSSRGTRLARFPFTDGKVLDSTDPGLTKHSPVPGSTTNTATVDPVYGRLAVRYVDKDGRTKYQVHDLDLARLGIWSTPLATIDEPKPHAVPGWPLSTYGTPYFQGYAVVGRYLYMLHGNAYGDTQEINGETVVISRPGVGNTFLSAVDLTTGAFAPAPRSPFNAHVNPCYTAAANSLIHREPEGLGVRVPDPARPGVFSIGIGFAGGEKGERTATIYGKSGLIAPS